MALELVTPLPPGAPSHTRLAKHGVRLVVLREIKDGTDCSWPEASPNMVTLQEVGELQGKRHALFPWVPGVTLREVVKALELVGKPAPIGLVGRVVVDVARALSMIAPARPHGGIQDAAMQIGFDGTVSVLDYGAPRVSRFRPIGRVNFAADVFALGGVVHSMLTGFQGDYASPPVSLALPSTSHAEATPAVDDVVMRALSSQPDSRQPDAASFADELETVLGEQLFTNAKLAEVVSTLFKDRIKVLQSLGGLIEESPNLEAVLPDAIPPGTQPGAGGRAEPPSEPTLPRIALGDANERGTDIRIPMPAEIAGAAPSRSMVPWDSGEGFAPASGPRPSGVEVPSASEPVTNPRAELPTRREAEEETNPRGSAPRPNGKHPADTDESSAPKVRASAPRPLGAEDDHAETRAGGPRALSRVDVVKAGSRDDDTEDSRTAALPLPEDTAPRAAPVRARANVRPADSDPDLGDKTAATEVPDDTNPRGRVTAEETVPRARKLDEDTGPVPGTQPRVRNTTEAERHRAYGQERVRTPPAGTPAVEEEEEHELGAGLDEPTAVKNRPKIVDPQLNAVTAQKLPSVPAEPEAPESGGKGLRVVMVLMLLVVVGLAVGVVLKLKRESEKPLPIDEPVAEIDAGSAAPTDAGHSPTADSGIPNMVLPDDADDGGEEEEDDLDGGAADAGLADAGAGVSDGGMKDGGVVDAGTKAPVKKPVKKTVKKKKKKKKR